MAFLARSVRGQQDPPATEATPSQPSQPSTPPFRVGLFLRISACRLGAGPAALAGKAIINGNPFHPRFAPRRRKKNLFAYSTWPSCVFGSPTTILNINKLTAQLQLQPERSAVSLRQVLQYSPQDLICPLRLLYLRTRAVMSNPTAARQSGFVISATSQPAASSQATGPVGMIFGGKIHPVADLGRALGPSSFCKIPTKSLKSLQEGFSACSSRKVQNTPTAACFAKGKLISKTAPGSES
jgi:hypothetical protein